MSLVVWLPMTKDLRQQGLSDVIATNNGATFDATNGKLGGCYYFNGTATSYISTDYSTKIGTSDFSISLWVKIPTITSGSYFAICTSKTGAAASVGFGIYWNYSQKKFLWSTADGSGATEIWTKDTVDSIVYDRWIHLVMVRDSNDSKIGCFYIDGIRYDLASIPIIRNIATDSYMYLGKCSSNNYPVKMYLSDFRIYDHALSPMEVKQISQGLILHYPLNREGWGQKNLLKNSSIENSHVYNSSSLIYYYYDFSGNLPTGTYTCSFDIKSNNGTESAYCSYATDSSTIKRICSLTNIPSKWTHYSYTFNVTSTSSNDIFFAHYTGHGSPFNANNKGYIYVKNIKLENGSIETSWSPAESDDLADIINLNDNIEYDTSGFYNNGTKTGTFDWISNSPRYGVSTKFNTNYIERNNVVNNPSTTAFWVKFDSLSNQIVFTDYNTVASLGIYNNNLLIGYGADCKLTYPKTIITTDKWYHVCIVKSSNATAEFYLDGILQTPGSTTDYWTKVGTNSQIGARSTNYYFKGNLSDFRIYATALSADDVLALYENSAYISSNATTYAHEFVEE